MPNTQHNSPISEQSVDASPTGDSVSMVNTTARRVSQRTTDLIAIAIVSVGVLTVSGRLAEWWNTDPADTLSPATSAAQMAGSAKGWGSGESAVHLLAGDAQVQMERRIIFGDQFRVDRILRDRLVEILESPPAANQPDHQDAPPSSKRLAREQHLIQLLNDLSPIESRAGMWNLYRIDRTDNPIPATFLIATRIPHSSSGPAILAAWALAMPSGPAKWTSFVMTPASAASNESRPSVAMPAGATLVLSLQSDTDDELTVFQQKAAADSDIRRWTREISSDLDSSNWRMVRSWQLSANSAAARFNQTRSGDLGPGRAMELYISYDSSGTLTGTANVIGPPRPLTLVPVQ